MLIFTLLLGLAHGAKIMQGDKELLLVQAHWRYGDRSPTSTYHTDPYRENYWTFGGGGWGQLSPTGMLQHVKLGQLLRKKYVDQEYRGFLSNYYNSKEVYYRSTDVNRTLISAMSNILGMWGQPGYNNRLEIDLPNSPLWPAGYVPVPIHTVDDHTDYIANADARCDRQDQLWDMAESSKEVTDFNNRPDFVNLTTYLSGKCGMKITADNIWKVTDPWLIEKIHCPDFYAKTPWYTNDLNVQADDVDDQMDLYNNGVFNEPLIMNGLDIGLEIQKLRGGSMTNDMNMHMNLKLDCFKQNKTDGGCHWISNIKFYAYSAHDTSLYAFLTCLGIEKKAVKPKGYPHYSAAALVELWYDHKEQQPYFKMLYHSEDGKPFETITSEIDGCSGSFCKLEVFQKIAARMKPDQPMPQWCQVDPWTQMATQATPNRASRFISLGNL